jgi:hypothetical protein
VRRPGPAVSFLVAVGLLGGCRGETSVPPPEPPPVPAESGPTAEVEPNDRVALARELGVPATVEGKTGGHDVDWYRLPAGDGPRLVRLEATGPGDLVVQVYAPDGETRLLRSGAAPAGAPEVIDGLLAREPLLVRVSAANREEVPYRLETSTRPLAANAETEPNDRIGDGRVLPLDAPVTGTVSREEDEDVWRLDLPAPAPDANRQALKLELSAVPGLRPALAVLDRDGNTLVEHRARETGQGVSFRNLAVGPGDRHPAYVVVKSAWTGKHRTAAPDTPYRLVAKLEPVAADLEDEPNDRFEQATHVFGLGRIGYLAPAGDVDWYALTVDRPVVARVVVSGVDDVDLVLDAPDPAAGPDAPPRARSNTGGVREGEILPNLWLPPGTNYLRVSSASRKVGKRWVRDYENPAQTYTLGVAVRDAFPGDEVEPNDTPAQATPLRVGERGRGMLYPWRDVDVFRLDVGVEDEGTLVARVGALPRVQVSLALRGGEPVDGEVPILATAEVDKAAGEARLVAEVEPGVYFLEVRGQGSNPGDSYRLEVGTTFDG